MPTSKTRTTLASEQSRWPRVGGVPHPQLRRLLARDYAGFAEAPAHPNVAVPATAAITILLRLKDAPRFPPEILAGAHDTVSVAEGPCSPAYVELRLAPLGAYRLLGGLPIHTLTGQLLDLTDVLGTGSRRLADQLRDTRSWPQRFGLLDTYLLRQAEHGPDPAPEVAWAWRRLTATGGRLAIRRLAGEVGWSHKHLITRFKQQVGLAPKTAARLIRFEGVWRRLAAHPPVRWDALAADSGYFDQAHLIRDFHQFTGATPTAFLAHPQTQTQRAVPPPA
jgi:AraC-like DNA-binding protein